jgi:hypothetical protein
MDGVTVVNVTVHLLVVAMILAVRGTTVDAASPERDCTLKTLAFEFGSSRVANAAAL